MQDQYVGDIGDFVKYGLLRAISKGKCLGVAWYLCTDPGSTKEGDGRHTGFLDHPKEWRHLDCELFYKLKKLVHEKKRKVKEVQKSGILGNAVFADKPVDVAEIPVRCREPWRRQWFEQVKDKLSCCDLVFADPDNGLYPDDRFRPRRKVNAKRIPLYEAKELAEGRTAVIYHHNNMTAKHCQQIREWMDRLPGCTHAYYWKRQSPRTFFVINPDPEMERRLEEFADRWTCHGKLVRDNDFKTNFGMRRDTRSQVSAREPTATREAAERAISKEIARIPRGHISTYKRIGQQVYGHDRAAQTVGNIISDEMEGWHRVVRSDRSLSKGAPRSQKACLEREGICFDLNGKVQKTSD